MSGSLPSQHRPEPAQQPAGPPHRLPERGRCLVASPRIARERPAQHLFQLARHVVPGVREGWEVIGRLAGQDRFRRASLERGPAEEREIARQTTDRKSTRLNSSHSQISYAVFCLKKKKKQEPPS